jgi:signal transduction histidine kinase
MLLTFQGGILALVMAQLIAARHLSYDALVPPAAAGVATVLLIRPTRSPRGGWRLLGGWFLLNLVAVFAALVVTGAPTSVLLAAVLTPAVCAGMRRPGYVLAAALAIPALFLLLDRPSGPRLPGHALACLAGLLSGYLTARFEQERRHLDRRLEGFEQAVADQQPLVHLGRFAQGLAHEFHNVLGGVQGLLDYAARSGDPSEVREALEVSARSLQRAVHIVDNLKSFTREAPLERRPCDLAQIVADSLALVGPECRRAGVEAVAETAPAPPVLADPARLQQVFLNLLLNAIQAMRPGGRLTVRLDAADGRARVAFIDTGCGIPPQDLPSIFQPRFTTRADSHGLGLGLAVSDRIIRAHGGSIQVESAVGRGSTFTILLPEAR